MFIFVCVFVCVFTICACRIELLALGPGLSNLQLSNALFFNLRSVEISWRSAKILPESCSRYMIQIHQDTAVDNDSPEVQVNCVAAECQYCTVLRQLTCRQHAAKSLILQCLCVLLPLKKEYPSPSYKTIKFLAIIFTSYLSEKTFSAMSVIKTKQRN